MINTSTFGAMWELLPNARKRVLAVSSKRLPGQARIKDDIRFRETFWQRLLIEFRRQVNALS
jgi:hypothetical protein